MADYYVDPLNGDDLAAGSEAAPWQRVRRAVIHASANDVITVNAPNYASAVRGMVTLNKDITLQAPSGEHMHASACFSVAEGDEYERLDIDDYFQTYAGATPTTGIWTRGAGTASSLDASGQLIGAGCLLLDGTSARQMVRLSFTHVANRPTRMRILVKTATGATFRLVIRGASDTFGFNTTTGEWESGVINNDYPAATIGTDWYEIVTPFISGLDTTAFIQLEAVGGTGAVRIQRSLFGTQAAWSDVAGVKQLSYLRPSAATEFGISTAAVPPSGDAVYPVAPFMQKCTEAEWQESGAAALDIIPTVADVGDLVPGSVFYDATAQIVHYMPAVGEDFDSLHLEIARGEYSILISSTCTVIRPKAFASQGGIKVSAGAPNILEPIETQSMILGYQSLGSSTPTFDLPKSRTEKLATEIKQRGGGFFATETSVMTVEGGDVYRSGDDGYQCAAGASLKLYGCTSREHAGAAIELINSSGTPSHIIKGFSGKAGLLEAVAFMDQSTGTASVTMDMDNCAFDAIHFQNAITRNYTVGGAVYCAAANAGGASIPAAITNNVNYSASLGFASSSDLTPEAGSDLVGTGTKWWTDGNRPVGADGEPFLDNPDVGGIQSKHSIWHPSNL